MPKQCQKLTQNHVQTVPKLRQNGDKMLSGRVSVTVSGSDIVFKQFLMMFGLRRYGELLKLYCKNEVILNIRTFLSQDATIQTYIGKSSQNGSKIYPNLIKMEP